MDRLRAIQYFIQVAHHGSFTKAGKSIGVPASSISRRIQDLEADLGASLLTRTTRVVKLTELGTLYLEQVAPALRMLDYASDLIKDQPASPSGRLRITSTPGYGNFLLVAALRKLRLRYPDLVVDLDLTDRVSDLVGDDVDIAIRTTADLPERAIAKKLADNNYLLVASKPYLDRHGVPKRLTDLSGHKTLLYRSPGRVVHWQAKTAEGWIEVPTHPAYVCNIGESLVAEAESGTGLAVVPKWGVEDQLRSGVLQAVTLVDARLSISRNEESGIYLLYHQPKYRLNKIKASVDFLVAELTNRPRQAPERSASPI